jgi:hypothetical protein
MLSATEGSPVDGRLTDRATAGDLVLLQAQTKT